MIITTSDIRHITPPTLLSSVIALGLCTAPQMAAQVQPKPALVDSVLTIMKGDLRPAKTVLDNKGKEVTIPATCAFHHVLPPGKKALQWDMQGNVQIDIKNNTCEAAFEVGVPAEFANVVVPLAAATNSAGYYKVWWTEPAGATVASAQADIQWQWEPLMCATYLGGGYSDFWNTPTGWFLDHRGPIGSVTDLGCSSAGYTGSTFLINAFFPPCTPLAPMYLNFDPVQVAGTVDGYLDGYGSSLAQGPGLCYLLLRPHDTIVRTWN